MSWSETTIGKGRNPPEKIVKDIKRATRKQYCAKQEVCSVLDSLHGKAAIAAKADEVKAYVVKHEI